MSPFLVKKIAVSRPVAAEVAELLDRHEVPFRRVECVNWPEYPYQPHMEVRMAHTDEALLLHFRVSEQSVAAVAEGDNGRVWEDSCVEFFCSPAADGYYYNLECNCVGTVLLAVGKNREGRQRAPEEVLQKIDRWSSLGREPFAERREQTDWQVALVVPSACYFLHDLPNLSGRQIIGNFYKCGDHLMAPHFLSLYPIDLPRPDFHRPDFFGPIVFE